jgi:hypothetical protein
MAHFLLLFIAGHDDVHPKTNPDPIQKRTNMNKDITTESPKFISDEQLEEAVGGLAEVENHTCVAAYQTTAQINL